MVTLQRLAAFVLPLLFLFPALAQLPLAARLDLLELQMSEAVKVERYPEFLRLLEDFQQQGGRMGPELSYYEAVAREKEGQAELASEAVARFIAQAGREHPLYAPALLLYGRVEPVVRSLQEARQGLQPLIQALGQGRTRVQAVTPSPSGPAAGGLASAYDAGLSVRGTQAAADGGWTSFGALSLPAAGQLPLPAWWRQGADGQAAGPQAFDVQRSYMAQLLPGMPMARTARGIGVIPTTGPGTVVALGPGSVAAAAGLRIGDRITHVDGRALRAEDNLFQKRDQFFEVLRAVQGDVRLGVERAGSSGLVEIRVPAVPADVPLVAGMRFGLLLNQVRWLSGAATSLAPRGETVAWLDDGAQGARVCANLRFQNGGHGVGLWGRLAASGEPARENLWIMPEDHPTALDGRRVSVSWLDSTVFDCVRLPDGALLVASAATRRGNHGTAVIGDSANRAFRVFDAAGHARGNSLVQASPTLERANAAGQRLRFVPLAGGNGWRWAWGDWLVEASPQGLQARPAPASLALVELRTATGDDAWHRLVVAGRAIPLVGKASARDLRLQQMAELADGSVLALLTLRLTPSLMNTVLPDGQFLGGGLVRQDSPVGLVVALDPAQGDISWAVVLRHGQAQAGRTLARAIETRPRAAGGVATPAAATLAELDERGLQWTAMTVLENGDVLLQTGLDQRVLLRPAVQAGQEQQAPVATTSVAAP